MLEIWKNHEDKNQRPSSAALNSLSSVLQTWVFQRASDPSDPYTSIHGLDQFFTILTSAHHTIKKLYYLAYLMACFVQILKMTFRKKTFLYFVISYVSYFTMACAFNYGFVALKFTMDGRDRKKNRKEVKDQGSVECEFQPNQYPWLCQAIYLPNTPQHHREIPHYQQKLILL